MKELTLTMTVDEANLILEGLGKLKFVKVYALITKIQEQAKAQANGRTNGAGATSLAQAIEEANHVD